MPSEFRRLALLGLAATAAAERCNVDAVVVHCEARCAGVNATSFSRTRPVPGYRNDPVKDHWGLDGGFDVILHGPIVGTAVYEQCLRALPSTTKEYD